MLCRHWATESLPGIRFANPGVEVSVDPTTRRRTLSKGKAAEDVEEGEEGGEKVVQVEQSVVGEPWKLPPGIFISFRESLPPQS